MSKRFVCDIETDALHGYKSIHVAVLRDIDTGEVHVYRACHANPEGLSNALRDCDLLIGHNILDFDLPALRYFGIETPESLKVLDTLVLSKLLDYNNAQGHSLEAWGEYFGVAKSSFSDFCRWSQELEDRCIGDTLINLKLYQKFKPYVESSRWQPAIGLESFTVSLCRAISVRGFHFDKVKAEFLRQEIDQKVTELLQDFNTAFPPKQTLAHRVTARLTKKGTINASDFRFLPVDSNGCRDLTPYVPGQTYEFFDYIPFNPSSSKQRVERLNEAGWKPFKKTKGHKALIREIGRGKPTAEQKVKLEEYKTYGWTCDEENLKTLPKDAPEAAHKLAEYLILSSRLNNLTEWLSHVTYIGRIHGNFNHIGAWSHRASHNNPNMANIPSDDPYGKEFRALWTASPGYKLVGVDADGIQLRIFAHLCNDQRLIKAIESGNKDDKTDIHSLNKDILGIICKSRDAAKTFIYALLLGASLPKIAEILGCSTNDAREGMDRIFEFYPGWRELQQGRLIEEGEQGYITCIDGRRLKLPEPRLALTGHLQSGEKIIMAKAASIWYPQIRGLDAYPVNWVHDEWQTEVRDAEALPEYVRDLQMASLLAAGKSFGLNISTPGSQKMGYNWKETH